MKGGFNSLQMKRAIAVASDNKNVIYLVNKDNKDEDSNVVYKISNINNDEKVQYGKKERKQTIKLGALQACKLKNPTKTSSGDYNHAGEIVCKNTSNLNIGNYRIEVPLESTSLILLPEIENAVVKVPTEVVDEPAQLIDHVKKELELNNITYSTALVITGYAKVDPKSLSKPPGDTIKKKICVAVSSLAPEIKSDNSKLFRNLAKTFRAQGLDPTPENTAVFQELVNKKDTLSAYVADCQGSVNTTTADSNPVSTPNTSTESTPASNVSLPVSQEEGAKLIKGDSSLDEDKVKTKLKENAPDNCGHDFIQTMREIKQNFSQTLDKVGETIAGNDLRYYAGAAAAIAVGVGIEKLKMTCGLAGGKKSKKRKLTSSKNKKRKGITIKRGKRKSRRSRK
jgi:hypothetical protein